MDMILSSETICTLDQVEIQHKCTIREFRSLLSNDNHTSIQNGVGFEAATFSNLNFKFSLLVYTHVRSHSNNLVEVYLKSHNDPAILVTFSIGFLNSSGQEWYTHYSSVFQTFSNGMTKKPDNPCYYSTLLQNLVKNDLVILCKLSVLTPRYSTIKTEAGATVSTTIQSVYNEIFENMRYADLTIVVEGKKMRAHKAVLAANSKVFAAMFDSGMKESKTREVLIEDISHDALYEILRFSYTGRVEKFDTLAVELLSGAEKYELNGLKEICETYLISTLTVDNVCEVYDAADTYSAHKLRQKAISYINDNTANIFKTDGWKKLSTDKPKLVNDLYCQLAEK